MMIHRKYVYLFFLILLIPQLSFSKNTLLNNEENTIAIFKRISPYVVNINRLKTFVNQFYDTTDIQIGIGSGFVWDNKGHIVTNYHVIRGAGKITITLGKGKTLKAKVVGVDPHKDIAVLKVEPSDALPLFKNSKTFPTANSSDLSVGQSTIAIGNPFGLDRTLTTGVISALGRQIPGMDRITIRNMIQTDASINPGNSGGPLLNSRGELIGMNAIIFSRTGTYSGIGFAIPSNDIKRIVPQLIHYGKVKQPGLGVLRFGDHIARNLGVEGVIIQRVIPGTPAAKAGLRGTKRDQFGDIHLGDVIVGVGSTNVKNYDDLYNALSSKKIGDTIKLKVLRDGETEVVEFKTIDLS